ncbi:MAG: hypothetical protein QME12_06595 [Nanoarchaeota archaeon]|nr:hypothetical protein [Nanoarchaeota archaeon]
MTELLSSGEGIGINDREFNRVVTLLKHYASILAHNPTDKNISLRKEAQLLAEKIEVVVFEMMHKRGLY